MSILLFCTKCKQFAGSNSCGSSFNFCLIKAIHSYHHVGEGSQIFRQQADHEIKCKEREYRRHFDIELRECGIFPKAVFNFSSSWIWNNGKLLGLRRSACLLVVFFFNSDFYWHGKAAAFFTDFHTWTSRWNVHSGNEVPLNLMMMIITTAIPTGFPSLLSRD